MPTIEEAGRCPECGFPGRNVSTTVVRSPDLAPGTQAKIFECVNDRCSWYKTTWVVQVNPDGTIPERAKPENRTHKGPKANPDADRMMRMVQERLENQYQAEIRPGGGEISS